MFTGVSILTRVNDEYDWFRTRFIDGEYTPEERPEKGARRDWESTFAFSPGKILATDRLRFANRHDGEEAFRQFKSDILLNGNPASFRRISIYLDKDTADNYSMKFAFAGNVKSLPKNCVREDLFIYTLPLSEMEKAKEQLEIGLPDFLKEAFLNELNLILRKGEEFEEQYRTERMMMHRP